MANPTFPSMAQRIPRTHPDHRPDSYWRKGDPEAAVVAGIRDEEDRHRVLEAWRAGNPLNKDGEFLGAVTVVRILLGSVHGDVIDLLAIPIPGGRIKLLWQDEYESGFTQPFEIVDRPLTQAEMIRFIEGSCLDGDRALPLCYNEYNLENDPEMIDEELRGFTRIESKFYPGLSAWFGEILEQWISTRERDED